MKPLIATATIAFISSTAFATPAPWSFIQSAGGLLVGDAVKANGQWVLPVQADVSGLSAFSAKPTQMNSGMACSKVEAVIEGRSIFLTIQTAATIPRASARCPDAELGSPVAGIYTVFYRGTGTKAVMLKEVHVGL